MDWRSISGLRKDKIGVVHLLLGVLTKRWVSLAIPDKKLFLIHMGPKEDCSYFFMFMGHLHPLTNTLPYAIEVL